VLVIGESVINLCEAVHCPNYIDQLTMQIFRSKIGDYEECVNCPTLAFKRRVYTISQSGRYNLFY